MKKLKRVTKTKSKRQPNSAPAPAKKMSRRDFVATLSNVGLVAAVGGGFSWFFVSEVCATTREADLTVIGNGTPTIVQIHDPECPHCRALQAQVRDALSNFDDGELQYVVANIRQSKGRALANKHGVEHVTLLLFDGKGERRRILAGPNNSDFLTKAFRSHIAKK